MKPWHGYRGLPRSGTPYGEAPAAPPFPCGKKSLETQAMQITMNVMRKVQGRPPLREDGVLDDATCAGAAGQGVKIESCPCGTPRWVWALVIAGAAVVIFSLRKATKATPARSAA